MNTGCQQTVDTFNVDRLRREHQAPEGLPLSCTSTVPPPTHRPAPFGTKHLADDDNSIITEGMEFASPL